MAIIGGGYIALEMASIMNGFGVNTKLIYRGDQILRGFDKEIRIMLLKKWLEVVFRFL